MNKFLKVAVLFIFGISTLQAQNAQKAKALLDDEPRSLFFIGKLYHDDDLFAYANRYEKKFNKRLKPDLENIR